MGGNVFNSDDIVTPRMPMRVYKEVLRDVEENLSKVFDNVVHAIEGPEKTTYGDVDVLVMALSDSDKPCAGDIAYLLGAVKWIDWQKNGVAHFAIPWPEDDEQVDSETSALSRLSDTDVNDKSSDLDTSTAMQEDLHSVPSRKHVQLDITCFSNPEHMRWKQFVTSHGDLCNIISNIIRSKGLTINIEALYLRIASVEKYNRKAGRIELSCKPEQVLQFLDLDPQRFWQPFDTLDKMMEYAATCRFFQPVRQRVENTDASIYWTDQKYLNTRPIFKYWIDTFLPAHKNNQPGKEAHLTREETLDDVFDFFGPEVKQTYEAQKAKMDAEIARQLLWPRIRSAIREIHPNILDNDMNDAIKAVKRISQYDLQYTKVATSSSSNTIAMETTPLKRRSSAHQDGLNVTAVSPKHPYTVIREAYKISSYDTLISLAATHHAEVLCDFRAGRLEDIAIDIPDTTATGTTYAPATYHPSGSIRPTEIYTAEDDKMIREMKTDQGATWPEIMGALGKESKSQLVAHWKEMNTVSPQD